MPTDCGVGEPSGCGRGGVGQGVDAAESGPRARGSDPPRWSRPCGAPRLSSQASAASTPARPTVARLASSQPAGSRRRQLLGRGRDLERGRGHLAPAMLGHLAHCSWCACFTRHATDRDAINAVPPITTAAPEHRAGLRRQREPIGAPVDRASCDATTPARTPSHRRRVRRRAVPGTRRRLRRSRFPFKHFAYRDAQELRKAGPFHPVAAPPTAWLLCNAGRRLRRRGRVDLTLQQASPWARGEPLNEPLRLPGGVEQRWSICPLREEQPPQGW